MLILIVASIVFLAGFVALALPKLFMRLVAEINIRLGLVNKDKLETYRGIWIEKSGVSDPGFQRRVMFTRLTGIGIMIGGSIWIYVSIFWFS